MSHIQLTEHAQDRALRRHAIGKDKLIELCEKAMSVGDTYRTVPAKSVARWMKGKMERSKNNRRMYIYSGYAFIFHMMSDHMLLVTVFPLPKWAKHRINSKTKWKWD